MPLKVVLWKKFDFLHELFFFNAKSCKITVGNNILPWKKMRKPETQSYTDLHGKSQSQVKSKS